MYSLKATMNRTMKYICKKIILLVYRLTGISHAHYLYMRALTDITQTQTDRHTHMHTHTRAL